jgi:hypothetical protein
MEAPTAMGGEPTTLVPSIETGHWTCEMVEALVVAAR